MLQVRRTLTEDARAEQWRLLSQFSYEPYIIRYFASHGRGKPEAGNSMTLLALPSEDTIALEPVTVVAIGAESLAGSARTT